MAVCYSVVWERQEWQFSNVLKSSKITPSVDKTVDKSAVCAYPRLASLLGSVSEHDSGNLVVVEERLWTVRSSEER